MRKKRTEPESVRMRRTRTGADGRLPGLLLAAAVFLAGMAAAAGIRPDPVFAQGNPASVSGGEDSDRMVLTSAEGTEGTGEFTLSMLDVGQGLCLLLESDGRYAVYDGGNREHSSYVVSKLSQLGLSGLDYLIASHYDEDHVSGLIGLLNTQQIGTVLTPDYTADSEIYHSFREHLASSGAAEIHPCAGETYLLGSTALEILGPQTYGSENENDRSLVIRAVCGDFSVMIPGDAETGEEEELISSGQDLSADVLVVGHHGSVYSTGDAFLRAVGPQTALISVGAGNKYGHPSQEVLDRLNAYGIQICRTDELGDIRVSYDGNTYSLSADPDTYEKQLQARNAASSGTEAGTVTVSPDAGISSPGDSAQAVADYIGNASTRKFHYPDCASVEKMNESNKVYFQGKTRDEIIALGFEPCKNCNP